MNAERWQKLKSIFNQAIDMPADRRSDFIDRNCNGDNSIGSEIEKMLAAAEDDGDDLERNAFELFDGQHAAMPLMIGKYKIVREIGRGGMGAVYEGSYETRDFTQRVAIKVIKRGMDTDHIVRRFRHEQKILASLVHPNITQFIDGGMTDDDLPYYAMEYVEGRAVDDFCRDEALSLADRLHLFRQVCSAVQFAHQNLIIHRDLKPKNILVTADGVPKLLDFGIGKILDPAAGGEAGTATQLGMMTPAYASPEQVRGKQIGTTSDIYSLGIVLYELLTGHKPYVLTANSQLEIERAVCETEPRRPSSVSKNGAPRASDNESGQALPFPTSLLRGDLDNILLKCLRKDPNERYASVQAFSEDLRRYAEGRPVSARADTFKYRAGKFIQRNRVGVAAAAIVFISLVLGITAAIWQAHRAEQQRVLAERRFGDVRELANNVVFKYHDAIAELPGSTAAREMLVRDALAYLDRLEQEGTGDVDLQKELALAYLKMGDVQGKMYAANVGDTAGALASYNKSIALFESVVSKRPDDIDAKDNLIQAYDNLAFLMLRAGGDARTVVEKALALFEQIPPNESENRQRTRKLIDLYIRFGDSIGPRSVTLAAHQRALSLVDQLLAAGEQDYDTVKISARANQRIGTDHYWLGIEAEKRGDTAKAREHFDESLIHQRTAFAAVGQMVALAPEKPESQRYLAAGYGNLAESLAVAGFSDEALDVAGNFLNTVQKTLAADPNNKETRLDLSNANEIFANIYKRRGEDRQAIGYMLKALAIDEAIYTADNQNFEALGRIAPRHRVLVDLYQKTGQPDKADLHRRKTAAGSN